VYTSEDVFVSLNSISGVDIAKLIKSRAPASNQVLLQLLDTGSSHTFINAGLLDRLHCNVVDISPMEVRVANGQTILCSQLVKGFSWWVQGYTFTVDALVLPLGAYDMVLGMTWLEQFRPMNCDWQDKWVEFNYQNKLVRLQGISSSPTQLQELSAEQLYKSCKGNDIWALAVVHSAVDVPGLSTATVPPIIKDLLSEYSSVFQDPKTLPPSRIYDHVIPLIPQATPANSRPYRYSPLQKDEIEKQVREMLQAGLITPSMSPFASPVLLVKKKDGSWRFCVDYRKLNDITIKNKFPMPIIDELLDELAGAHYFAKLDMKSGFHQIRMLAADEYKTAFKTHHGHFQFKVMPFGLTNAPATFQCLMNAIFAKYLRKFVLVFMDDILVYSPTLQTHVEHLKLVFEILKEHQLVAKFGKCTFAQTKLEYLGHIISGKGVSTDPAKTQAMVDWPIPSNVTELRGFLGLTGYYRKFVRNYGLIAKPLTQLLKRNSRILAGLLRHNLLLTNSSLL